MFVLSAGLIDDKNSLTICCEYVMVFGTHLLLRLPARTRTHARARTHTCVYKLTVIY